MEELIPIVAGLAGQMTGNDSTSVTYEKAGQLMEAVLYCIREFADNRQGGLWKKDASAQEAYYLGHMLVAEKAERLRVVYNEMMVNFCSFGNYCLRDTMQKGIPEFLRWYDTKYSPQITILTLDYPVLRDLSSQSGVDAVYEYVCCICQEQGFLSRFGEDYVKAVLRAYTNAPSDMIENILSIVLMNLTGHFLLQKPIHVTEWTLDDYEIIGGRLRHMNVDSLSIHLADLMKRMIVQYYNDYERMAAYIGSELRNIAARIMLAVETRTLHKIFFV